MGCGSSSSFVFHPPSFPQSTGRTQGGFWSFNHRPTALALISGLIYGEKPSWKDPVKYGFAVGGEDGVPFPVVRTAYDEAVEVLESAIKQARVGDKERINAVKRLRSFTKQK
ncbi:MAG: hypothetical protein AOA65_0225 [Candidatus Bathyarchaeota archaeon BA1]|nr:MAG: hypothetical protein AOA65_0225 [Candidatus Bathyarchaeota archaeon BA1]